jgi:DMSO/TMAO reductase YedYZ molybdopterin-dependent catalytic subunit
MSDEPLPVNDGQPVDEVIVPAAPVIHEPTPEEIEAARLAAIAANDTAVAEELRRMSRRGFIGLGAGAVAAIGAWKWLGSRSREDGLPWPLRRMLGVNEAVALSYFSEARVSPSFPPSQVTRPARINGGLGLNQHASIADWRLDMSGTSLTLDDIRAFPRRTMVTEFRCIEGWSTIVQWSGARLADVMAKFPPPRGTRFVSMETPDRGYYVGLDIESAMHPQTLLAYEMNGAPLTWQHGAPLRLAIPVKYGVKNIKRIGRIAFASARPADYWAEQGYDWYAGH